MLVDTGLSHSMKKPGFPEGGILAHYTIKNKKDVPTRHINNFTREAAEFPGRISFAGIPHRVVILAGDVVNYTHGADVPEIMRAIPILSTAHRIPKARGIHPLASIIRGGQHIFRPKEFFGRIKYQDGIVRHGTAVIVQIVRTLGIGVIGTAVDG